MTARKVHYTSLAYEDLTSLLSWIIAERGVEAAAQVDTMLESAISSLATMPDRGRRVPELKHRGFPDHREIIVRPYRVVYYPMGREVWVVAILDGRRDVAELLQARAKRVGGGTP